MSKTETRTMYMHTLDGEPATFERHERAGIAWLGLVGGRNKVKLAGSLSQIRTEWNEAAQTAAEEDPGNPHAGVWYVRRCGYVLVEVPV